MASNGRRSDEGGESSFDRDYPHQRRRQHQHPHPPHHYNQPYHASEQMQHGQLQNLHHPPQPPYHQNGTNGNYNNINNNNNSVPVAVPPRMRLRKWSDMTRTIWHYERIEQIGEGTYGQVYRARCKDTNEIVAMKKIRVHHGAHWGMPPTVIREIKILKRLVHPNLVRMIEVVSSKGVEHLDADDYHKGSDRSRKKHKHKSGGGHGGADANGKDNNNSSKNDARDNSNSKQIDISDAREGYKGNLFLVLEYIPHDLTGLLDVAYKFSEVEIKCVFRQLLEALRYMHDQKYVHRDIKSSNILIDRNFRLKLADFGLARSIEPPLLDNLHDRGSSQEFTNKVITLWYRPPELLLGATRYGFAVDIWSAGCILAELVLGRPLFTGKTEMDQLQLIFDMVGTPTSKTWPGVRELKLLRTGDVTIDGDTNRKRPKLRERYQTKMNNIAPGAINLVEKLLELDPSKRLTASRALNHRYFLQEPQAPDRPEALGEMKLAEGGSFHEFQTKKKRKEAKAEAEKIKQAALDGGHTTKQAQEEYDACYRGIMEKVAREGLESSAGASNANSANEKENGKMHGPKAGEGENREISGEKIASGNQRDPDGYENRHSSTHRSSRSDRSQEHRGGSSRTTRDSSSRGKERRSGDKNDKEKNRDGSSALAGTSRESGSSHRDRDRDHSRERSRTSRRTSESEDRRKKRRREEDTERSTHSRRDTDKERHREHLKAPKVESEGNADEVEGTKENASEKLPSTSDRTKEEKESRKGVATDDSSKNQSMQKSDSAKPNHSIDSENNTNAKEIAVEKLDGDTKDHLNDASAVVEKPDKTEGSKPDQEKQPGSEHHSRSTSSRGDKKRSDRSSRDRPRDDDTRKDRRERDRDRDRDRDHHRRRSSKDRDGRTREGDRDRDRASSRDGRSKKRKSRTRSRSPERGDGSPGRSRDDRHHRQRRDRDRDHSRRDRDHDRDRDRERRPHHDDLREMDRRARNDRDRHLPPPHHHPHRDDDWRPGMGGRGPPPPSMQRRGGDFGGGGNPDFGRPPPHRHDHPPPRGGDPGMYGPGGGDRDRDRDRGPPPPRGGGHGPGDFHHGPPGRHPGPPHPHGGRPYPPPGGGDYPPPGFRDRDRGGRRDRDRR